MNRVSKEKNNFEEVQEKQKYVHVEEKHTLIKCTQALLTQSLGKQED